MQWFEWATDSGAGMKKFWPGDRLGERVLCCVTDASRLQLVDGRRHCRQTSRRLPDRLAQQIHATVRLYCALQGPVQTLHFTALQHLAMRSLSTGYEGVNRCPHLRYRGTVVQRLKMRIR